MRHGKPSQSKTRQDSKTVRQQDSKTVRQKSRRNLPIPPTHLLFPNNNWDLFVIKNYNEHNPGMTNKLLEEKEDDL